MATIPIIKGDRIVDADYRDALPVNMYAVARQTRGFAGYLINQPGIAPFGTTQGVDRGAFYSERLNSHFRVTGTSFIEISTTGAVTVLGAVSGSLQVQMDESANNIAIVADEKVWYYNRTDGFRQITATGFAGSIDVSFNSGVFVFTDRDTIYHTTVADEEVIEPTDFASSELSPDPIVGIGRTAQNLLIVWNSITTEFFFFDGGANFAFSRVSGKASESGMIATDCNAKLGGTFFVLGRRREESLSIYYLNGSEPVSISTREIDKIFATYSSDELQSASLESREEDGSKFLHVNLPNETLMYNATVAKELGAEYAWSILKTSITSSDGWAGINGILDRRTNRWVYGDRFNPRVGLLDNTISTIFGAMVECLFYSPFITLDGQSINELEIKTISGFTPQEATVSFSVTSDGETYGREVFFNYGNKNQRSKRFIVRAIGHFRDYAGLKFRAVTPSRLAFGSIEVNHG